MAQEFFGISEDEAYHLFIPGRQAEHLHGAVLDGTATKEQVAANIRTFVAKKESK